MKNVSKDMFCRNPVNMLNIYKTALHTICFVGLLEKYENIAAMQIIYILV